MLRETTAQLELVAATAPLMRAAANEDRVCMSEILNAVVAPDWPPEFLSDALAPMADDLERKPNETIYTLWFVIQSNPRTLIGTVGLKSPPVDGRVDTGYGIVASAQRRGFATEATQRLIDLAFNDPGTDVLVAETLPGLPASIRVMEKLGLTLAATNVVGFNAEENVIRYELPRARWAARRMPPS